MIQFRMRIIRVRFIYAALIMGIMAAGSPVSVLADTLRVRPAHYDVNVELFPIQGFLKVSAKIRLRDMSEIHPPLSFFLHETFQIQELSVNGEKTPFSITPASREQTRPACNRVDVQITDPLPGKGVELFLRYNGALKTLPQWGRQKRNHYALDDHIGADRVELACYSGWYPLWEYGPGFDADLHISLPEGWRVTASGKLIDINVRKKRNHSHWRSASNPDLIILASPRFRTLQVPAGSDFGTIAVIHTSLPQDYVRRESGELSGTLELFSRWLGPPTRGESGLRHVFSPREWGQGGYSRPGIVVTSEGRILAALEKKPGLSFLRGNAHEIAHFWWNFARNQADWINETFAEYFSLLVVEQLQSPEKMNQWIGSYRKKVAALPDKAPPLSQIPAENSEYGYTIRYLQGALMLHAFREYMGLDAFMKASAEFLHRFAKQNATTDDFRTFWSNQKPLDPQWVQRWLDQPRGNVIRSEEKQKSK